MRIAHVVKINVHKTHFCEYLMLEFDKSRKTRQDLVGSWSRSVLERQDESGEFEKGFGAQSK